MVFQVPSSNRPSQKITEIFFRLSSLTAWRQFAAAETAQGNPLRIRRKVIWSESSLLTESTRIRVESASRRLVFPAGNLTSVSELSREADECESLVDMERLLEQWPSVQRWTTLLILRTGDTRKPFRAGHTAKMPRKKCRLKIFY